MTEEEKWIYVGEIPILVSKRNFSRLVEIEMWLYQEDILKDLGIAPYQTVNEKVNQYVR
jgi:hypothetical protein